MLSSNAWSRQSLSRRCIGRRFAPRYSATCADAPSAGAGCYCSPSLKPFALDAGRMVTSLKARRTPRCHERRAGHPEHLGRRPSRGCLADSARIPARNETTIVGDSGEEVKFRSDRLRHSLRTISFTFMHVGSVASLEDVVDHDARGGRSSATGRHAGAGNRHQNKDVRLTGFVLSAEEKSDLLDLLRSLSGSCQVKKANSSNHWIR